MKLSARIKKNLINLSDRAESFVTPLIKKIRFTIRKFYKRFIDFARRRPILTFGILIGLLLLLIVASNFLNKPKAETTQTSLPVKNVAVYTIGESPTIVLQAQVEKSGVIKVVALGSGVIGSINVQVGSQIAQGTNLVSMTTNYQGGNAFAVQRQLAQVAYKNVLETYDTQISIIDDQKKIAEKSNENSNEIRDINAKSIESTQSIINLNNDMLSSLESQLLSLQATNVGGANDGLILQNKQIQSQLKSANLQLQSSYNNLQYTTSDSNPPSEIANISKDITLKQLEIQQKAVDLNKEVSRLSLQLAQITEGLLHPVSPIAGTVERVYVKTGQVVSPGTPLMQISGESDSLIAVVPMSRDMAKSVSKTLVSTIYIGDKSYQAVPFYVSNDATDGSLFSAQYIIPTDYNSFVTDKQFLIIKIPVASPNTGGTIPFIPLDSVFQTQDESYVFVVKDGYARSKRVILGSVVGSYVEVKEGLEESDQVILNRNVIDGDPVKIVNN